MANNVIKRIWNQNKMVNIEALQGMAFQAEDGGHTFEISGVDDHGNPVALSGTVAGIFRRPDNADIALTGTASDGVVSVTLTDSCYTVPGKFGLTIYTTSDSKKTAVYAAIGTVASTSGGAVAGDTPQDVVDLVNAIAAAVATIPASYTGLMAAVAPTYSTSAVYPVGFYVWHDGTLHRCTTPITTAETWTAAHWTAAVLGDDVGAIKSALGTDTIIELAGQVSSGTWVDDSRLLTVLIKVNPGSRINVKATSVGNSSLIGAIKNVTLPIPNGSPVTYSSDSSWSAPILINKNQSFSGIAPADIEYLYYYCGFRSSNFSRMPVSVEIDDYDYLQSAIENISKTNTHLYETSVAVENKTDAIQTFKNLLRRSGSIDGGVWVQSNTFSHILYPVNPGDVVEVFGKSGNTAYIFGLKTGEVVWGQAPGYSDEIGWTGAITITDTRHWYGIIPNDVHYLYMYYGSDEVIRLPSEVYVNGYNIIESIADNASESREKSISNYEYYGDTSSGKWSRIGDSAVSYILFPVNSGDKIEILTSDSGSSTTYVNVLKSYSNPVTDENLDFSEAEGFTGTITVPSKTYISFTVPQDAHYCYVYEGSTASKPKRPVSLIVNGYDYISGKQLLSDESATIRIAQFNIGKFAFGYSNNTSASTFGLLSMIAYDEPGQLRRHQDYTYDEYVTHYRKMLLHYHPDIIGMEEYLNPIDVMRETDPNDTVSKNMADEVFDFTYPSESYYSARQQCIRARFAPILSYSKYYSYVYNGETIGAEFTVNYYLYCGKLVCVGCNALASTSDDADMARRAVQLPAILDLFKDEDFVFLTFDVNNGGNFRTSPEGTPGYVSSPEEGAQLLAIAESKGWTFAHGKYLPFEKTWFAPTGSGYGDGLVAIDNIIYKDNGKTILRDFEVMPVDDARDLSSDHCPIFGEFLLL